MFKIGENVIYTSNLTVSKKVYNKPDAKKAIIVDYDKDYNKYQIELKNTITLENNKVYMWVSPNTLNIDYLHSIEVVENNDDLSAMDKDILNELLIYYVEKEEYDICSKIKKALTK